MENKVNLLIHCHWEIIRIGLEEHLKQIFFQVKITYADLFSPGILKKCNTNLYDMVIVVLNEPDEDFGICTKLKIFIPDIPVVFISPFIPFLYKRYLKKIGIDIVLELPITHESLEKIKNLLKS